MKNQYYWQIIDEWFWTILKILIYKIHAWWCLCILAQTAPSWLLKACKTIKHHSTRLRHEEAQITHCVVSNCVIIFPYISWHSRKKSGYTSMLKKLIFTVMPENVGKDSSRKDSIQINKVNTNICCNKL